MTTDETVFSRILRGVVAECPGALGGVLAAIDGEAVDLVARDRDELLVLTAHTAVVVSHVRSALRTFHFGDALELMLVARGSSILVHAVSEGYFALLALEPGASLGLAQRALGRAAVRLRAEIA